MTDEERLEKLRGHCPNEDCLLCESTNWAAGLINELRAEISRLRADLNTQAALTGGPSESLDKALKEIDGMRLEIFATRTQLEQARMDMAELRQALMKIETVSNDTVAVRIARRALEGK